MKIALSPCPNDTYLFHGWIQGLAGSDLPCEPVFSDIEQLNLWALEGRFELIKLSFATFGQVANHYQLLPIGSALGHNCGPKVITKNPFPLKQLYEKRILIPGEKTTAHLLLRRLLPPPKEKLFCSYNEVMTKLESGQADCGVIIHESRFLFKEKGFVEIADLGALWHQKKGHLIPLGGLAVLRTLDFNTKAHIVSILNQSLTHAKSCPPLTFMRQHAQEQNDETIMRHVGTYVTEETKQLSSAGRRAICCLLEKQLPEDWLFRSCSESF